MVYLPNSSEKIIADIKQKIKTGSAENLNNTFCLIAAQIFIQEGVSQSKLCVVS